MKTTSSATFIALLTVILLMTAGFSHGQQRFTLKEADNLYANLHFASAIPLYEAWIKSHPDQTEVKMKLADSYRKLNDSKNGERVYSELIHGGAPDKEVVLSYAEMLAQNGKYKESKEYYDLYHQKGGDLRGARFRDALNDVSDFYRDSSQVKIEYLIINSAQEDFSPAFYKNGLVYCSSQIPESGVKHTFNWNHGAFLDLFIVKDTASINGATYMTQAGDKNKKIKAFKGTHSDHTYKTSNDTRTLGYYHSPSHTDTLSMHKLVAEKFNADINTKYHEGPLVFFNGEDSLMFTRNNFNKGKYHTDKQGVNRLKLYTAKVKDNGWAVKEFPYNSNEYSVGHPALNPENTILYFSSDMPGGKGGSDIWYCVLGQQGWTAPQNLDAVNTEGQEMFPFIDNLGNLYFASNGWGGLGGLDVFYSRYSSSSFGKPLNLGFPINSMKDDFGLIVNANGRTGYFSSSRNAERTQDDIYYFNSKKTLGKGYSISGLALQEDTRDLLPGTLITLSDDRGNEIYRTATDSTAAFAFAVEPGKNYTLKGEKENHLSFAKSFSTNEIKAGEPAKHNVLLTKKGTYSVSGLITDRKSGETIDSVKVTLIDATTNTNIIDVVTPGKAMFSQALPDAKKGDACNFILKISKKGYLSRVTTYNAFFEEPGDLKLHDVMDIRMDKVDLGVDIGRLVKINPIYFDVGKAVIRADAGRELNKIVQVMIENPGMKIELGSHTDARGSEASNFSLSDKRAKASAAYIVSEGIAADRITGRGYGESKLVNQCEDGTKCSEADHQLNRRTEFVVTDLGN